MARIKLHSEQVGLGRERLIAAQEALAAQFPGAEITVRRLPRYGNGYTLSVYGEGQGKLQTRGHCQYCGRDQVIKNGVLVKHGYRRPGTGYEVGRCPGAHHAPLQTTDADTIRWLAEERNLLDKLQATLPGIEQIERAAVAAFKASGVSQYAASNARPYLSPTVNVQARIDAHEAAMVEWAATYPAYAALLKAQDATSAQRQAIGQSGAIILHFEQLIGLKLPGTPLLQVEK